MSGCPAQCSISRVRPSAQPMATQIDPRYRWCQLFSASSQQASCHRLAATAMAWSSSSVWPWPFSGPRMAISEPASMKSWRNVRAGSEPAKLPSSGNVSVRMA